MTTFLSTYWPMGNATALDFARRFYALLVAGQPIGAAVLEARRTIREQRDWAD